MWDWLSRLVGSGTTLPSTSVPVTHDIVLPKESDANSVVFSNNTFHGIPATSPSASCIFLIEKEEGCATTAYQDVDGVYVLGYGCKIFNGKQVVKGQTCSAADADKNCRLHAQQCANGILNATGPLTQGQLDALTDFVYNAGLGALLQSTILKTIKDKQPVTEDMFTRWNKIHKDGQLVELPALTSRRQAEWVLYNR